MKPRIFIAIHYLELGGAESSLIGLLQTLDSEKVEVDLFLYNQWGEMMEYIPKWVNVLPTVPAYTMIERPIKEALQKCFFRIVAARLWAKLRYHLYAKINHPKDGTAIFGYVGKYVTKVLPSLERLGIYDLAVSYTTPHDYVLHKVKARKKICRIHSDYTQIDVNTALEYPVWNGYDYIVSISQDVTRTFLTRFPTLKSKILLMENIQSSSFVWQRAAIQPFPTEMNKVKDEIVLLTIGRYSYQKKLDEIPIICRYLLEKRLNVKWYIIGYGDGEAAILEAIRQEGMEEHVIVLGKRANPYPYIRSCDWYVQPSRYEGKSVTVREAQILCKPVIITNYPTAASQVQNGIDGVIVPLPVIECVQGIYEALRDETLRKSIIATLSLGNYGNEREVEKIYALIGNVSLCQVK